MARTLSRRDMLRSLGVLGLTLGAGSLPVTAFAAPGTKRHSRTALLMGTFVTVTVAHPSGDFADEAAGRAFEAIRAELPVFDGHDRSSALSVLNRDGELAAPPPQMVSLMEAAANWHRSTDGAFDPSVTPLVSLFREAAAKGVEPDRQEVRQALELVHAERIVVSGQRLALGCDMAVTLDGIAKGALVDRASEVMSDFGASTHLINAGGDIRARTDSDHRSWRVAVQSPDGGEYPAVTRLRNGAVASSGSYESLRPEAGGFAHLLDPRTGYPCRTAAGVTVIARNAAEADALSTAVYVLGPRNGLQLVRSRPGTECLILGPDGTELRSSGFDRVAI